MTYCCFVAHDPAWLNPTWFIDSDHEAIGDFASDAVAGFSDITDQAIALFHAVRDGLRYDPYSIDGNDEGFRASNIVGTKANWCVPKAVLLTAAARNRGIPARLGFADVRNHLTSEKLHQRIQTDLFIWHGFSELLLGERWFQLSTAFNIELCRRFGVKVLAFDGTDDALMHPFDESGSLHMEYVSYRGSFDDLPLEEIRADFAKLYPGWWGAPDNSRPTSAAEAGDDTFAQ